MNYTKIRAILETTEAIEAQKHADMSFFDELYKGKGDVERANIKRAYNMGSAATAYILFELIRRLCDEE